MARAQLTIDLEAIVANWLALDAMSGPGVRTAAVVKADAYGLGAERVAPALAAAGARQFFVALAEEGAALREILGPDPEIYVLSGLLPGDEVPCRRHALIPCLASSAQIVRFRSALPGHACAVQVDTGMNRLGLEPDEARRHAADIRPLAPRLLMSHLACADTPEARENVQQEATFAAVARDLPAMPRSLAATGGILLGAPFHADMTRPGIGLFGGRPFEGARPVVRLSLPVIQTRRVEPGESVGYGATWRAGEPRRIATVSAGYADGILRAVGDSRRKSAALFDCATPCPIVGRISMDLIAADVTDLPTVPDRLDILCAGQGIDDLADAAGTIGYEILTSLGHRFERVYKSARPAVPDQS